MFKIKFNAIDIEGKIVYCGYRNIEKGKNSILVEKTFSYNKFIEIEPNLLKLLEDDAYYIYLEDDYSEKKFINGTQVSLTQEEIDFCKNLVHKACINLEYETLLIPPPIDEQIDAFIKEFFEEEDIPINQKDFLENFFAEIENKK